jgi:hypothetical protein
MSPMELPSYCEFIFVVDSEIIIVYCYTIIRTALTKMGSIRFSM